jgi:hypothetical protein
MVFDLPESVKPLFVAAGWHPGREVPVPSSVPADHPAAAVLVALGGLTVIPGRKAGEECAPDDLAFQELESDESVTEVWGGLLGTRLIGVAETHRGHCELYVAADGRCFGHSLMHDAFYFEGASFAEAVERSLLGRRAQPMLRPDQPCVTLYGVCYTADSPDVYRWGGC